VGSANTLKKASSDEVRQVAVYVPGCPTPRSTSPGFGLKDDLGTSYVQMGSRHGSGSNGIAGEAEFEAPRPDASVLVFSRLGLEVPIHIY
jgi:hypothetical protein